MNGCRTTSMRLRPRLGHQVGRGQTGQGAGGAKLVPDAKRRTLGVIAGNHPDVPSGWMGVKRLNSAGDLVSCVTAQVTHDAAG
jgi:hypothetical protein